MQNVQVSSPVFALAAHAERRTGRSWRHGSTCWTTDSSVLLPQRGTTPASSRRPSASSGSLSRSHSGTTLEPARRPSRTSFSTALGDSFALSSIHENHEHSADPIAKSNSSTSAETTARNTPMIPETHPLRMLRNSASETDLSQSFSALETDDENESEQPRSAMHIDLAGITPEAISRQAAQLVGQQLSDAVKSSPSAGRGWQTKQPTGSSSPRTKAPSANTALQPLGRRLAPR